MTSARPAAQLTSANLEWRGDQPLSAAFGDVYFSSEDGLAESHHVFIDGNDLTARWAALDGASRFTIIETGFGTGLNFLAAVSVWLQRAPPGAQLHYVSVEKFPLRRDDLCRALSRWPTLAALASELTAAYPPLVPGFHRRWLYRQRVCLTLIFDDATSGLESLVASAHPAFHNRANPRADAWFLDGFAPAKNPDLWSPELFALAARLSGPGTTASTFTVARQVRDGLEKAGFTLAKAPGFGGKRDMLKGAFRTDTGENGTQSSPHRGPTPKDMPWHLPPPPLRGDKRALVIGGGIAGCASAAALMRRGWRVTVVERHHNLGAEASGNPQGILYPRLSVQDLALSDFGRQALCHAMDYYRPLWLPGDIGQQGVNGRRSGVLVLPESPRDYEQFPRIVERYREADELVRLVTGSELSALAGVPLAAQCGLWYPSLGWVSPPLICQALAAACERIQGDVAALRQNASSGDWDAVSEDGTALASAPVVILASAHGATRFTQTRHLPLRRIRGQISAFKTTPASSHLKTVICGAGYLAPEYQGLHTLGATYDLDDPDTAVREEDHLRNLDTLTATDPQLSRLFEGSADSGRAALRCTTPDYLPVAGPAPLFDEYLQCYDALRRNARADIPHAGPCWQGLWINAGHGSRGLTYAPLAAELIASQICGEPPPLPRELAIAVHPGRFIIRDLKRNKL